MRDNQMSGNLKENGEEMFGLGIYFRDGLDVGWKVMTKI